MSDFTRMAALRKRHYGLEAIPDTIVVPALGARRPEAAVKRIEDATLDDIAFALRGIEAEFNAVGDRLHALRRLYVLAREAGALGCERPIDLLADGGR
ncbi:hypothetical protein EDC22_10517 [Tepidamorphus gemmatus]|uniref:Uncharacterized protein n=1 Tax=Tepidamorphus gemmatus TaxID=747076 RepID=A0A4R3MAK5_9HYPH|nr:hypothetical protein [Tepidamorphus gemmatus]TCT10520.1 hypothetical protein EDC22_10517 [Tepidamorphus gemmatus]